MNRHIVSLLALVSSLALFSGCSVVDALKARDAINKGVKAYNEKRYTQAAEHFRTATELDPALIDAQLYLAHSYRAQYIPGVPSPDNEEKAKRAITEFQVVIEKEPENDNALASIAGLYGSLGEADEAKEWYRKRIAADPGNAEPYYGIGTVDHGLAEEVTGIEGSRVEELTEEERQRAQEYTDEGIEALNQALEIKPDYADAVDYLNLLYRQKGYLSESEEEKEAWERKATELALRVNDLRREQKLREERERRMFKKAEDK